MAPVERIGSEEDPVSAPELTASEPGSIFSSRILASPEELPKASYRVVLTLFVLLQMMYLGFYIGALA